MNWTKTIGGVEVTFYKHELPSSRVFGGKWLGWFECDLFDHIPTEYATEPTAATVETLYTG